MHSPAPLEQMRNTDSHPALANNGRSAKRAAILYGFLVCLLLTTASLRALDPNKHLTQEMHTSWRIQDGSAPSGMYTMAQTSDGFLWFLSSRGELYRFDGVQFRPWHLPPDAGSIGRIRNIVGDHTGGLWALGADGIAHIKDGTVISHIAKRRQRDRNRRWLVVGGTRREWHPGTRVSRHRSRAQVFR